MPHAATNAAEPRIIGRYALFDEIASGGMATVHLGRLLGPVGFGRTVAIKRLHEHFLKDPEFVTMFMDEARIVARIRHPNVVPMVDVVQNDAGIYLIMEYVHGESLSRLLRTTRAAGQAVSPRIVASILSGVLMGLHAAHETKGPEGELLNVVHRDVSPQNVIVGVDGVARMLDFGIAKAAGRAQITREGQIKGKLAYMAPEQIRGQVDRRTDVFAAAVVLWEALAGRRLHEGLKEVEIVTRVIGGSFPPPSAHATGIPPELDAVVLKALAADPAGRYADAKQMALALERAAGIASPREITEWVEGLAHAALAARTGAVGAMERRAVDLVAAPSRPPKLADGVPNVTLAMMPGMKVPPSALVEDQATTVMDQPSFYVAPAIDASMKQALGQTLDLRRAPAPEPNLLSTAPMLAAPPMPEPLPAAVAQSRAPLPPPRPLAIYAAIAGMVLCAVIGIALGGFALYKRARAIEPPPALPSARPAITAAPSAAPLPPAHPSATATTPEPPPKPASTAPVTTPSPTTAATSTAPSPRREAPAAKKPSCDPPYTEDANGHRHYKQECLDE